MAEIKIQSKWKMKFKTNKECMLLGVCIPREDVKRDKLKVKVFVFKTCHTNCSSQHAMFIFEETSLFVTFLGYK